MLFQRESPNQKYCCREHEAKERWLRVKAKKRGIRMAGEPLGICECCGGGADSFDERWIDADICHECSDALADPGGGQLQEPGRGPQGRDGAGSAGAILRRCEFCGYAFDERCGRYGCPNCEGEGLDDCDEALEYLQVGDGQTKAAGGAA